MKNFFYFTLAFLFTQSMVAQSTSYLPFPIDSAHWWASSTIATYEGSSEITTHYFFKGEFEAHNTYMYAVLYKESGGYYHTAGSQHNDSSYYPPQKTALIRENNKRIYVWNVNDSAEKVLYDFNWVVGDTAQSAEITVTQIDSILIQNQYRKQFWLTPSDIQVTPKQYTLATDIKFTKGIHTLYMVYTTDDPSAASSACVPTLITFKLKDGI